MSKIVIVALALSLFLLGFSGALFAFDLPIWLPVVLVVLSVVLVALMASKVAKKMRKVRHSERKYSATTGPMTPMRHNYPCVTPPRAPRR
jgi:membrane protein implicated in regulation of membrane protease activity